MTSEELKRSLRDPALLNLICAFGTLNRIYNALGGTVEMAGHYYAMISYVFGFLLGIVGSKKQEELLDKYKVNFTVSSYVVLVLTSVLLLYAVFDDMHKAKIW